MLKQFNLSHLTFDDPIIVINNDDTVSYQTNGDGWYPVLTEDDVNAISATITGGGVVYIDNGELKWSGKAPDDAHVFDVNTRKWKLNTKKQTELKAQQILQVCASINAKRDKCVNGGVYVPLIKKWVDSDDIGRATLVEIKADFDLNGKDNTYTLICADNTAQVITFDEFKAVWDAVKSLKEAMFENAYMHKILVASVDNPLKYDWSIGWSKTYEEYSKEQENE